ncbi:MAG TPA: NAD(P)/FAD-dependent oxidoreductase [Steroidobacteraceae bacterium]|nr:NAD(P)/FAD-dependent oxidoreductase [Steroidobacteraceae bacterium]
MTLVSDQPVNIVGAGLAGALLAVFLARRGLAVDLYDRRPDPRLAASERGRSINLALAARGIVGLERAGMMERIRPLLIPMRGRMVHSLSGETHLQPYGQRHDEVIYSVGRADLNRLLIEEAARHPRVRLKFRQTCLAASPESGALRFRDEDTGSESNIAIAATFAADGAGSAVRSSLARAGLISVREDRLDHDYKELTLPAAHDGRHQMQPHALHIWPRGGFMLIALPNTDGSFTATLFLARSGPDSFDSLADPDRVRTLFQSQFADATRLMPHLLEEFTTHPQGQLGAVHTKPWHIGGQVLLLGDAAHAIVPFHGQGMNAALEDCLVLDSLLDQHDTWDTLFAAFERSRIPNAAAIAQMALENYLEMRDTVRDPTYLRRKALAMDLERRFPDRFIPRYSMVMFHPEISYAEALRRGEVQARILQELTQPGAPGEVDFDLARALIAERLFID